MAPIRLKTRVLLSASWKNQPGSGGETALVSLQQDRPAGKAEAEEKAKAIAEALGWEDNII